MGEREQRISELYDAALKRPPGERASFLAHATAGDTELCSRVQALLAERDETVLRGYAPGTDSAEQQLTAGTLIGTYRIEGPIGAGGMGVVYFATDTKLNRPAAVKVLAEDLADPEAQRSFQREAQMVSSLNHPHILTVYDAGEYRQLQCLITEYVDGGTLRQWGARPRGWRPIVELLIGVADAIATAHEAGILHRDIKPENILLTKNGYAKLADFGIAKLLRTDQLADDPHVGLRPGKQSSVIGTAAYMSPEQTQGLALDARSDVFSFGLVLCELLGGNRTVERDGRGPAKLGRLSPVPNDVPAELRAIVAKALEVEPADRYQTMRDLVVDLRRLARRSGEFDVGTAASTNALLEAGPDARSGRRTWSKTHLAVVGAFLLASMGGFVFERYMSGEASVAAVPTQRAESAADPNSIAVLPFRDISGTADYAYLADGLAEDVLNLLARNHDLRVAARTSSFTFRDHTLPVSEIASRLDVSYVLEGSVRRDGEQIRVTVQLIAADDGYQVWSETYDESFDGVFSIQNRISSQIARALETQVLSSATRVRETDAEAYAWYLQAKHMARQITLESMREAVMLLRRVVERDPEYAPAWSSLASVHVNLALRDADNYDELYREARRAALTAIRVDPAAANGYVQLAWIAQQYDGDFAAAIEYSKRALELQPTDEVVLGNAAILLMHVGQLEQSIAVQEYSAERSPLDATAFFNLGLAYTYADRLEDAERSLRTALRLSPGYDGAGYQLGEALLLMGRSEEALEAWEANRDGHNRAKGRALAYFALGRHAESDGALAELIDGWGEEWPSSIVHVYANRGEIDGAFEWLEKEYEKFGAPGWGEWKYQRLFDNLRDDPRWDAFLERVGVSDAQLSPYNFEVPLPADG